MFVWKKVGPPRRVTLRSKRANAVRSGHSSNRANFLFLMKTFANFCKEMYKKFGRPGVAQVSG